MKHKTNIPDQSDPEYTKAASILNGKPGDGNIDDRNNITVFHKPSKNVLNFNLNHREKQVSLHLRSRKELIDLTFREKMLSDRPLTYDTSNTEIEPRTESVADQMWKPMTIETEKLLSTYLKLSKIRLTGTVPFFIA